MNKIDKSLTPKKTRTKKEKQRAFLASYAEQANVLVAARAAGVSRQLVYQWLEHDEDFGFAYNQAKEDAKDVLRAEIFRRAHEGWDEDVYQLAKYAGTVHKYSDTLLIFHAKMLMPEYRDKLDLNANVNTNSSLTDDLRLLSREQLATFKQWLLEARTK